MSQHTYHIAIVVSEFNQAITDKLLEGALSQLQSDGISAEHLAVIRVPGAVEIPLAAKLLAKSQRYDAIICLGAVIRGDTDHYDYVCQQVSQGCQQVMMTFDIPVMFGVLTTKDARQAHLRVSETHHKGKETAKATLQMLDVVNRLRGES